MCAQACRGMHVCARLYWLQGRWRIGTPTAWHHRWCNSLTWLLMALPRWLSHTLCRWRGQTERARGRICCSFVFISSTDVSLHSSSPLCLFPSTAHAHRQLDGSSSSSAQSWKYSHASVHRNTAVKLQTVVLACGIVLMWSVVIGCAQQIYMQTWPWFSPRWFEWCVNAHLVAGVNFYKVRTFVLCLISLPGGINFPFLRRCREDSRGISHLWC